MGRHRRRVHLRRPVLGRLTLAAGLTLATGSSLVGVGTAAVPTDGASDTGAAAAADRAAFGDPGTTLVPGTPCTATARACVDLATHTSWLISDGQVVRGPAQLRDGDEEGPTPTGTFRVEWKTENWTSREFGTPMPWSVFFAPGGISFHEGRQDTASAGCVKLGPEDAHAWFDYLQVGDEVQVR